MNPEEARARLFPVLSESTWAPRDVSAVLAGLVAGTIDRPQPSIGALDNGGALFYRGMVNGIAGESGCGKTWTALAVCAQAMETGQAALYIDLEGDAASMLSRLLDMGVSADDIADSFVYVSPDEALTVADSHLLAAEIIRRGVVVVVIDSTGEALAMEGANPNADEEVAAWFRALPTMLAKVKPDDGTGPAVIVLDHQAKDATGSLWPIGSQRKRAAIGGTQYIQTAAQPFAKGEPGHAVLRVAKDRHGAYPAGARVARLDVKPSGAGVSVRLASFEESAPNGFRPTELMRRVSDVLAITGPLSLRGVRERVKGRREYLTAAIDHLISDGYVVTEPGANRATMHRLVREFREPADAWAHPTDENEALGGDPVPRLKTGAHGHTHSSVPMGTPGHTGAHPEERR